MSKLFESVKEFVVTGLVLLLLFSSSFGVISALSKVDWGSETSTKSVVQNDIQNGISEDAIKQVTSDVESAGGTLDVYKSEKEYQEAMNSASTGNINGQVDLSSARFEPTLLTVLVMTTATGSEINQNYVPSMPIKNAMVRVDGVPRYTDSSGQLTLLANKEYLELFVEKSGFVPYTEMLLVTGSDKVVYLKQPSDDLEIYSVYMYQAGVGQYVDKQLLSVFNEEEELATITLNANVKPDKVFFSKNGEESVVVDGDSFEYSFLDCEDTAEFSIAFEYSGIRSKELPLKIKVFSQVEVDMTAFDNLGWSADLEAENPPSSNKAESTWFGEFGFDFKQIFDMLFPLGKVEFSYDRKENTFDAIIGVEMDLLALGKNSDRTKWNDQERKEFSEMQNFFDSKEWNDFSFKEKTDYAGFSKLLQFEAMKSRFKALKMNGKKIQAVGKQTWKPNLELNFSIAGKITVHLDSGKIDFSIVVALEFEIKFGGMFAVGFVPCYWEASVGVNLEFDVKFFDESSWEPALELMAEIYIKVGAGVGFEGILSGGIYGKLAFKNEFTLLPTPSHDSMSLTLGLYYKICYLIGKAEGPIHEWEWTFVEKPKIKTKSLPNAKIGVEYSSLENTKIQTKSDTDIFELTKKPEWLSIDTTNGQLSGVPTKGGIYDIELVVTSNQGQTTKKSFTIYTSDVANTNHEESLELVEESETFSLMRRTTELSGLIKSANLYKDVLDKPLIENVFESATPQVVRLLDGRYIATWIDDDGTRTSNNRTQLVYAVYENEKWSETRCVDVNSNTADFNHKLYIDDSNNVFLAWQNTKQIVNEEINGFEDMYKIAKYGEISIAKFDTVSNEFEKPITLTNNDYMDANPVFAVRENTSDPITIVWQSNSESDIFSSSGVSCVWYSQLIKGVWSQAKQIKSTTNKLLEYHSGYKNGELYVASLIKNDNTEEYSNENTLYVTSTSSQEFIISRDTFYKSNPRFAKANGKVNLYWYDNDGVYVTNNFNKPSNSAVCIANSSQVDRKFEIQSNNDKLMFSYIDTETGFRQVKLSILSSVDGQWSHNIALTNGEFNVQDYAFIATVDGFDIMSVQEIQTDLGSYHNLCFETVKLKLNISIEDVSFYSLADINNDFNVNVMILNKGNIAVSELMFELGSTTTIEKFDNKLSSMSSDMVHISTSSNDLVGQDKIKMNMYYCSDGEQQLLDSYMVDVGIAYYRLGVDSLGQKGNQIFKINVLNNGLVESKFSIIIRRVDNSDIIDILDCTQFEGDEYAYKIDYSKIDLPKNTEIVFELYTDTKNGYDLGTSIYCVAEGNVFDDGLYNIDENLKNVLDNAKFFLV